MTIEELVPATAAQVQAWRDIGQHEHADALRRQMWELLGQYLK